MKRIFTIILTICFFAASIVFAAEQKVGKPISIEKETKVSEILQQTEELVGKQVLVKGTIIDMCTKRGGWMEVAGDKQFTKIYIDAKNADFKFPLDSIGKTALIQGEVVKKVLTEEQQLYMLEHAANERGIAVDKSSVKGPKTEYQIIAVGAVIK